MTITFFIWEKFAMCRRKAYDQTGSLEGSEELAAGDFQSLYEYYRTIYKRINTEDIEALESQYRGSEEEKEDLLKYYQQLKGNMQKVSSTQSCSDGQKQINNVTRFCFGAPVHRSETGF